MNRFSQSATADQLSLYTALLDYGGAVQRLLCTADEVTANGGYADEYYAVTINNALATNLAEKTEFINDTFSKAEIEAGAVVADAKLDDLDFAAWADIDNVPLRLSTAESSATITTKDVKPGRTTLTAVYGIYGASGSESSDFTNGVPENFIERTQNIATVPENVGVNFVDPNYPGTSSLAVVDGKLVYNKVPTSKDDFVSETTTWGDCNYQWWEVWFGSEATADVFSAELDVTLNSVSGDGNFQLAINDNLPRLFIYPSTAKDENGNYTYFSAGSAKLLPGETYNIRLDWNVVTATLNAYVDGELVYTTQNTDKAGATKYSTFKFIADAGLTVNAEFDNVLVRTICVHDGFESVPTLAAYQGDNVFAESCTRCAAPVTEKTFTYTGTPGQGKYFNSVACPQGKVDVGVDTLKINERSGGTGITHGVGDDGTYQVTTATWDYMTFIPGGKPITLENGDKLIFEYDFQYNGIIERNTTDTGGEYIFIGLTSKENGDNNDAKTDDVVTGGLVTSGHSYVYFKDDYMYNFTQKTKNGEFIKDVWYNIRIEYTIAEDGASALYEVYVDDAETPIYSAPAYKVYYKIYGLLVQASRGTEAMKFDNFYMGKNEGAHDYVETGHHDMNAYLGNGEFNKQCTLCGGYGDKYTVTANGGVYFNDENATGAKADIGVDTINVAGTATGTKMTHGVDGDSYKATATDYAMITLRPGNPITPLPGEKLILEFDYMYEGYGGTDCYGFFGIAGADGSCSNGNYVENTGSTMHFYADFARLHPFGSTTSLNLLKGVWYNLRYEYTLNFDGTFNFALYVDDSETPLYAKNSVAVRKNTVYGIAFQGRADSCSRTIRFDNFYMGVEAAEDYGLGNGKYYADETQAGQRADFTDATVYTTGAGNEFSGYHSAAQKYMSFVTESLADGENRFFRFEPTAWTYTNLSANPNAGDGSTDNTTGVTVGTGDTLIAEFDFRYNGVMNDSSTASTPLNTLKFEFNTTYNGSENNYFGSQMWLYNDAEFETISFGTGSDHAKLKNGVWYNIRLEYVVGTGGSVYINGTKLATISKSGSGKDATATTWYGLSVIARSYCTTFDMDNAYLGVIPAATEAAE